MAGSSVDYKEQWQPPSRPAWVQRINEEGYCMNISGVVPLDEKSLLSAAMRSTGLSDFGADDWREPFRVFVKSLEDDADLNLMGRIRSRSEVLLLLEARLRIEDTYKRHPEIDDEQIVQPIIIIGQGRSGTSFLNNVLAANPDNGALLEWEAMFPCPPPEKATYGTDPRIEKADLLIKQWVRVTPSLSSMHEFTGSLPLEDSQISAINFMSTTWLGGFGQVSSYDAYMANVSPEPMLRYHKRVLKLLQWKNPRKHWVLKDPIHLDRLVPLLKAYPDACFVWPHRDPVRALASQISLIGTLQWGRSDHPFKGGTFEYMTDPIWSAQRLNAVIDQLENGLVPSRQICHILYKDLVGNTMSAMQAMYAHLGLTLSDAGYDGMSKYVAGNPRESRPPHKTAMTADAMAIANQAYRRYREYFNIPSE